MSTAPKTGQAVNLSEASCHPDLSAIEDALFVIQGKWTLKIVVALMDKAKRFNELRRAVRGISARVLSNELKTLEQNGIVSRTLTGHSVSEVAYELTQYSHSLHEVVRALGRWGLQHRAAIRKTAEIAENTSKTPAIQAGADYRQSTGTPSPLSRNGLSG